MTLPKTSREGDREPLVESDFKLMHKEWHNVGVFLLRVGGIPVTIADFVPTQMMYQLKRTMQRTLYVIVQPQSGEWQTFGELFH